MNLTRISAIALLICLLGSNRVYSQYILNGSAEQVSCNCYTLTPPLTTRSGSVWNSNKISLQNPFDFWFKVFLGCNDDSGADGIVFILQPISTSVGTTGEGMGFQGVSPSIGIALDTYQNFNQNDPSYDHISIQKNGLVNHSTDLVGPVPISSTSNNVEDCQWHKLRISWDPNTHWLRAYFDNVLRVETQIDLVSTIFNNDPNVFWGFTGATGGSVNLQQFCTALDPDFSTNVIANNGCVGQPISLANQSESFAPISSYNWDFGDGNTSTAMNPSPHVYNTPGSYQVKLDVKGLDGCEHDTVKTINIGALPAAATQVKDTCFSRTPVFSFAPPLFGLSYQWTLDGGVPSDQQPSLSGLATGAHQLQLTATSLYNCGAPVTANSAFTIRPTPAISLAYVQRCLDFQFEASQTDAATNILSWHWNLGDGTQTSLPNPVHHYSNYGEYPLKLSAIADNGCISDTVLNVAHIGNPRVFAGNDTVVLLGYPAQLHATGTGAFVWSPSDGLSDPLIANPVVTITNDRQFFVQLTTEEGCVGRDTVLVRGVKGPAIYVPTAFTPNGDGLNDILQPVYVGMKKLERFAIYNRWGQEVFSTNNTGRGWDGSTVQKTSGTSTYVWMIKAVDYLDQPVLIKGTVILIR